MKALIYYGPKNIKLEEIPMPEAKGKDVVIKVKRAGICGSDLTAYLHDGHGVGILMKGEYGHDGQFGHELTGVVHQIGSEVRDIKVGDRVFVNPTVCKRNGMMGCDMAGAFSEYMVVEDARYGYNLFRLSDDVSFDEAVVIEPLSVGTHGKNCIDVRPHENVVIYGAGTIGLCVLSALSASGCHNIVIVDTKKERLRMAEEMGAATYSPESGEKFIEFLERVFGSAADQFGQVKANVDAYIDCAGAPGILDEIISLAKNGAKVSIVAVYKRTADFNAAGFLSSEMTMKGSCGFQYADMMEAFQNVNCHRTDAYRIVTHHFAHADIEKAFEFAADPAAGGIKVVIDYE